MVVAVTGAAQPMTCASATGTGKRTTVANVSSLKEQLQNSSPSTNLLLFVVCTYSVSTLLFTGTCPFGISFVDSPKGDLDFSNSIDGPDELVVVNDFTFPYGTSEQFPTMRDTDLNLVTQSAHGYAECSNAGICDRVSGECECFDGFGGTACDRMLCPKSDNLTCNGHGVCKSIEQLARSDYSSTYRLWDRRMSSGCKCDEGYYGGDCSMRKCPMGVDPLFMDDVSTIQYPFFFFAILHTGSEFDLYDGYQGPGAFNIRFTDVNGQTWNTRKISVPATCDDLVHALEALPNDVVPPGFTDCYRSNFGYKNPLSGDPAFKLNYNSLYRFYFSGTKEYEIANRPAIDSFGYDISYGVNSSTDTPLSGDIYMLQFYGNPGNIGQPEINIHGLDGNRPTLYSRAGDVVVRSWTNGQQGTNFDHFTDHCFGIRVQVMTTSEVAYLNTVFDKGILKRCLAGADEYPENDVMERINRDRYFWDYGSAYNPHVIRLVRTVTDPRDGSFYLLIYWDTEIEITNFDDPYETFISGGVFRILHPFRTLDNSIRGLYDVFTTNSIVKMVGNQTEAVFNFASNQIFTTNITFDLYGKPISGDISCESKGISAPQSEYIDCLNKNDQFFIVDPFVTKSNAPYMNLYTVKSIQTIEDEYLPINEEVYGDGVSAPFANRTSYYKKYMITTDLNTNWAQDAIAGYGTFHIFKFIVNETTTYNYVAECSNRGICNIFEGMCDCFPGYSGGACTVQDSLAL